MSQYDKEITLLDSAYAVVGDPIKVFESLQFTDAWAKHGSITLVVGKDEMPNIKLAAWMQVDGRVYEVETPRSMAGDQTVKVTGPSLNVLFDRIVIKEKERLQGRLEERVRYLVNKYAITGSQRVKQLVWGVDHGYKRAMDITINRGQTLSEVLYTALPQRGYSFEITLAADGSLVFDVLQGKDRTQNQSANVPVSMSTVAEIEDSSYEKSIMDWRNFAVVCDEDETNPQTVEVDLSNGEPVRAMYVSGRKAGADDSAAPNMFVMVGQYWNGSAYVGYVGSSSDASAFNNIITSGYPAFWGADFQNGKFSVCGSSGKLLSSLDSSSWANQVTGTTEALEGVRYIDGVYLIGGTNGIILSSYDLVSFSTFVDPLTRKFRGFWHTGYEFIALAAETTSLVANNKIVAYRSFDAFDWALSQVIDLGATVTRAVTFDLIKCEGRLLSVGFVLKDSVKYPMVVSSKDNGLTFAEKIITALSGREFRCAAYGNGVLVAVGQPNFIAWSDDGGDTWNDCTPSGGTPNYITICFDGSAFHAYSETGKYHAYSATGKSFTLANFTATGTITVDAVVYGTSSHVGNLYQMGLDALEAAAIVETIDGNVNADLAPVYEVDYNKGDVIDIVDPDNGVMASKRVLEVEHLIDKTTDLSITPKLGKEAITLRELIAKEIKNNGI